ncbi:MAG: lysophospholipid acyltransferase family protein [Mycoplasmatales bacterium]
MRFIKTLLYFIYILIISTILIPIDLIFKFDEDKIYMFIKKVCTKLLHYTKVDMDINIYPLKDSSLIVANHESLMDIVVLIALLDNRLYFVAKKELKKIYLLSYWGKRIDCMFIDRENLRQSMTIITKAATLLKEDKDIVIFPEGTRSKEDMEFKPGSFKIASMAQKSILSITLRNNYNILPSLFKKVSKPVFYMHEVINYDQYKKIEIVDLAKNIQTTVSSIKK